MDKNKNLITDNEMDALMVGRNDKLTQDEIDIHDVLKGLEPVKDEKLGETLIINPDILIELELQLKAKDQLLAKYQQCINHIEDYFEYSYKNQDKEKIKANVMDKIIKLSNSI